jgi:hypothetical protein
VRASGWILGSLSYALISAACSSGNAPTAFSTNPPNGGSGSGSSSGGGSSGGSSGGGSGGGPILGTGQPEAGTGAGTCQSTDPNGDADKDGWTPAQGDCNDCDPNVNPGAIDVLQSIDGGTPTWGDEDCDGKPGDSALPCDTGLLLADLDPNSAAKAIELCRTATSTDRKYGVISASYVRADGTPFATPGTQVGIESVFGTSVHVQAGANMLALGTGTARFTGQAGMCTSLSCQIQTGTPPAGFPQDDPTCPKTPAIFDDVALELQVRVPSNATGYSFNFKFYSFEFPDWVCDPKGWNDQFITWVNPPPKGAYVPPGTTSGGNISFDNNNHPVSVNLGFFDVCDPASPTRFATGCRKKDAGACPATPSPYCPLGTSDLTGTGFDTLDKAGAAGATRWLQTQAPAQAGTVITIRFAIWDAGNGQYDSTVLVDNFQWVATGAAPVVGTTPVPVPK